MDWTQHLRLRHLQVLLSLAQTGNLSHSAVALNSTQPGLSKWLKELEDDIGLPLFERHARGLRPTPHGTALIAHARRIEAQLDCARDDMQALRDGGSGLVAIGTSGASASDTVPMALLLLLRDMPLAHVRLQEGTMDVLLPRLSMGALDIVVGRSAPEHRDERMRSEVLYREPIQLVAHARHPLFARKVLDWPGLLDYRWIVWPKGTPIRDAIEAALASAGQVLPGNHLESNSVVSNLTLLNNSNMIGFASLRAARRFSSMGVLRILPMPLSGFGSVSVYWHEDSADRAAVARTLDCLRQAVSSSSLPG